MRILALEEADRQGPEKTELPPGAERLQVACLHVGVAQGFC